MKPKVVSIWFSDVISMWRALHFTEYMQSSVTAPQFGYQREIFYTKLIDLEREERLIFAEFSASTRNLVHRSKKEGIHFRESSDLGEFASFFNKFANEKQLEFRVKKETLERSNANLRIFQAIKDDQVIAMHLMLCSQDKKRVRFHYGASILRSENKSVSNMIIGIANRALHFHEMCVFKREGFETFDLGGYAYLTKDPDLQKINDFKDSFGGTLVREANHRSVPLYIASGILNYVRRMGKGRQEKPVVDPGTKVSMR